MEELIVIIPTYNEEKNILKVLKDLNNIPVDVLIVDDGSTDNTKEVIQEYLDRGEHRNRIYTIFKERNEGVWLVRHHSMLWLPSQPHQAAL
ncbi:MAG TPA: glycosyltransferase [Pyrodictiaceae archaeon]|nr:glycosyltransferase [Pyrodictiaceae archaeon]